MDGIALVPSFSHFSDPNYKNEHNFTLHIDLRNASKSEHSVDWKWFITLSCVLVVLAIAVYKVRNYWIFIYFGVAPICE